MNDLLISSIGTAGAMIVVLPYITGWYDKKALRLYRKVRKAWRDFAHIHNHYAGDY